MSKRRSIFPATLSLALVYSLLVVACVSARPAGSSDSSADAAEKKQSYGRPQPDDRTTNVANQVELLKNWEGDFNEHLRSGYYQQTPLSNLLSLAKSGEPEGIRGIQLLIPYLTNTSPTKCTRASDLRFSSLENVNRRPIQLNEYIADVITRAANHYFYLASGDDIILQLTDTPLKDPAMIKWFQSQIEHWCLINANSSLKARKIADLNDWFAWNRFDACRWLGKSKTPDGRLPLERRLGFLMDDAPLNSMTRSESAVCAQALAEIGDKQSLPAVRRACDYIRNYPEYSSFEIADLFEAFHALAILGEKQSAIAGLKQYSDEHLSKMEPYAQLEFQKKIQESQGW